MPPTTVTASAPQAAATPQTTNYRAMAMVTTLFFMWGFLTCLNDILIPHLKGIFELDYKRVMLVQFAFFTAYFVFSFPSGKFIDFFGYKRAMIAGLLTMAIGAAMFVPAASAPSYPLFLAALIILAAGMTILQTSANPYVAVLGPPRTASSRLNLTQAFNSLGTFLAPFFGSAFILAAVALPPGTVQHTVMQAGNKVEMHDFSNVAPAALHAYRLAQSATVKAPYLGITAVLVLLAVIIGFFRLPKIEAVESRGVVHDSIWHYRHLILGAIGIFVYVGAEVAIGSFLVNYLEQPEIASMPEAVAAKMLVFYWGGAMIGRLVGSALLQKINTGALLAFNAAIAGFLVILSMSLNGHTAMWAILAVGLFNSIMFPSIFTLGVDGLGPLTGDGSALLIAAIVGGAVIPELQGILADHIGIHHAFILPVICYIYIVYYGFRGSRRKTVTIEA